MRSDDDLEYFEQRAESEIELASKAIHPTAVRAHYLLAGFYLDRVHGSAPDDTAPEANHSQAT
jgi:hypothetical protein